MGAPAVLVVLPPELWLVVLGFCGRKDWPAPYLALLRP